MKVRFYNIVWDTDGKKVKLPSEVVMDVDPDIDLEEESADLLSDRYGWCIKSLCFQKDAQ